MSPSLMPHAVCWNQDQRLIWTMVIANAITFLSYFSICLTLFYLRGKTRAAIARDWTFFLAGFALFIAACGSTHLMEVVTTWIPWFWVDAWTNIVTAILSGYVAVQIMRRAPRLAFGVNDYAARLDNAENEKAQAEESLLATRRLDEWNRMSAVVSHEINNPLAAIQNLLFLMQLTPELPPAIAGLVQQCADEARRIEALTRSTLGFFRHGKDPEKVDLSASVEAVRFLLGPTLRQRTIELVTQKQGDCTVTAYAVETRQVFLNLIRNACEATTRSDAKVTISLEGRPDDVLIVVADEGTGIDPTIHSELFQLGVSTKEEAGNGMGLWLVKQLVARHGGTIEAESNASEGARFVIRWPRHIPRGLGADQSDAAAAAR